MQSARDTVHITPAEWRWVIFVGGALVLLAFVPFLWVALSGAVGDQWQFMGVLNNYIDGATYISKMMQGFEGSWLVYFRHTSEPHNAIFVQVLYPALGQLARVINVPPIAIFHVARVVASLIMYMAMYYFASTVWPRPRSRRIFFIIAAIGSGLGWVLLILTGDTTSPDLVIPEIFPFYSSLVNVHFPLTITCLTLLASNLVVIFRPGCTDDPSITNGGLAIGAFSFTLSLLYPQSLVPLGLAVTGFIVFYWLRQRQFSAREARWLLVLALPALPMAAYYFAIVNYNPAAAGWNSQNITLAPNPLIMLIGLGVPLLIALPGIIRAVRRFNQDGDQLMLIWLITILIVVYLPTNVQRRFAVGLMIPIAYFATRALEDYWFTFITRRWRYRLLMAVIPTITMSYVVLLIVNLNVKSGPFLQRDYAAVFQWLSTQSESNEVILASPEVSVWVPAWVGARVVYAHPYETLSAAVKEQQVENWFKAESPADCQALISQYNVRFVIYGPQEEQLGQTTCLDTLEPVFRYNSVTVYAP